ncbi:MAG TPA: dethiobiotin synthase [Sunxiuqinia sp.]|nr:dethiobiotin synthase [Sunxiuqinia sp.]
MRKTWFISGIDTECGKTIVTGLLARQLKKQGTKVITQKMVQTGCVGLSDDLLQHRKMMGIGLQEVDRQDLTCPYLFSFPASPHLAARLENQTIDLEKIASATRELEKRYEITLLEGAGGLLVPINDGWLTIDYIKATNYPLILVSSSKLGSINHTLMSLEVCRQWKIDIKAVVYNHLPDENVLVAVESVKVFKKYLAEHWPCTKMLECPVIEGEAYPELETDWMV